MQVNLPEDIFCCTKKKDQRRREREKKKTKQQNSHAIFRVNVICSVLIVMCPVSVCTGANQSRSSPCPVVTSASLEKCHFFSQQPYSLGERNAHVRSRVFIVQGEDAQCLLQQGDVTYQQSVCSVRWFKKQNKNKSVLIHLLVINSLKSIPTSTSTPEYHRYSCWSDIL